MEGKSVTMLMSVSQERICAEGGERECEACGEDDGAESQGE